MSVMSLVIGLIAVVLAGCLAGFYIKYFYRDDLHAAVISFDASSASLTDETMHPPPRLVQLLYEDGMTPAEPFPYTYTDEYLSTIGETTRAWAEEFLTMDAINSQSAPRLRHDTEWAPLIGSPVALAPVRLGSRMARTSQSTVFGVRGNPRLVIKFQNNCRDLNDEIHPLLRDYWFLRRLVGLGVSPDVHFLSPPAKLAFPMTTKTNFGMTHDLRSRCMNSPRSSVRYMIIEKVGPSIFTLIKRAGDLATSISLVDAMTVASKAIRALQRMHMYGVVHGDVHPGNIVKVAENSPEIRFIDFGFAFLANEKAGKPEQVRAPLSTIHWFASPYELRGSRTSYRDDVFRAILVAALMMNGAAYTEYLYGLQEDGPAMLRFKDEDFLFTIPRGADVLASLPNRDSVRHHLVRLLSIVRGLHGVDELPPYTAIQAELADIISFATRREQIVHSTIRSLGH